VNKVIEKKVETTPGMVIHYFLTIHYLAPDNATDEKGKPVGAYTRDIRLTKESYKTVVGQMEQGKTDIFISGLTTFSDSHKEKNFSYINLANPGVIFAQTRIAERLSDEAAEQMRKDGEAVLYDSEGQPLTRNIKDEN
jgi:hypothetical protein